MAESAIAAKIDAMVEKLLAIKSQKPGKQVHLTEQELRTLCTSAKGHFASQPALLEVEAPINVCGSTKKLPF